MFFRGKHIMNAHTMMRMMLPVVILFVVATAAAARRLTYFYTVGRSTGGLMTAALYPVDFDHREPPGGTIYFSLPPENPEAQPGDEKSCAALCLMTKPCTHYMFTAVSNDSGVCRLVTSGNIIFLIPPPSAGTTTGFEGLSGGMFG